MLLSDIYYNIAYENMLYGFFSFPAQIAKWQLLLLNFSKFWEHHTTILAWL
jgi:hypothetical protein